MLSCPTLSSLSTASITHCHLPLTQHGRDTWDGMSSTSSPDQSTTPRTCFRDSALSAMEGMSLLSLTITLPCKHQLLAPSRLLLPQELPSPIILSLLHIINFSIFKYLSHQRDALPIFPLLRKHLPSESSFLTSLQFLAHSSVLLCHKLLQHGSVEMAQQLRTSAALFCRRPRFSSPHPYGSSQPFKLQFQGIQHSI